MAVDKSSLNIPACMETERLVLRSYQPGDAQWYFAMSLRNRIHLSRYESANIVMEIKSKEDAQVVLRDLVAEWEARNSFFIGVFDKSNGEFVAQVYVGPVNWDLPEFQIGYFADRDHEGYGYVTEAVKATLGFIFRQLGAHRVWLECDDTNVRSYRVAERCGMIREGHFRENKKNPDGGFTGTIYYALLRREFEMLNGAIKEWDGPK